MSYGNFIARKAKSASFCGIEPVSMNDALFPYQQDLTAWALRKGRAAIFADTGLGKTLMQLAWASNVARRGDVLILCPLAVADQTQDEAAKFGITARVSRDGSGNGIVVANYERIHKFDTSKFVGVVLDESSILKSYDGKTKTAIIESFAETPYKLACTATPAPNDHTELGNHAEFLGVCSRVEMLAEYFVHDGGSTRDWRVKGHAVIPFWQWVASWGAFVRSPRDLGYDGSKWDLPLLREEIISIDACIESAWQSGYLLAEMASGLSEERAARRATMDARVCAIKAAIAAEPNEQAVVWCELNDESAALGKSINGAVTIEGCESPDDKAAKMIAFARGEIQVLVTKPKIAGFGLNWQNCARCYFMAPSHSYEQTYQAIRRFWRYGQTREVIVRTCASPSDSRVMANIKRKKTDADTMSESLRHTATRMAVQGKSILLGYEPKQQMELPTWM